MTKRIAHPQENGIIAILTPMDPSLTLEDVAKKDVPAGVPYVIIDAADIPIDRTFRDAWELDFSEPDGYGIGHDAWAAEQKAKEEIE